MTSEVTSDLNFELSGLNNPWSSAFLASKLLYWTNLPEERRRRKPNIIPRAAYSYLVAAKKTPLVPIFPDIIGLNFGGRVPEGPAAAPRRRQLVLVDVIVSVVLSNARCRLGLPLDVLQPRWRSCLNLPNLPELNCHI